MACLPCFLSLLPFVSSLCPAFMLFAFPFLSLSIFALVVFCCRLSCFVFSLAGVAFSLSDYTQKERARRVGASSLVLLRVYYIFSASLIAASFAFENIHPAPQVRCALNLPPRVLRVSLIARVSPTIAIAFSE